MGIGYEMGWGYEMGRGYEIYEVMKWARDMK